MNILQVLGFSSLEPRSERYLPRIARKNGMDVRKNWGKLL